MRLLLSTIMSLFALVAAAQSESDFAQTYMRIYAADGQLTCNTIGPSMIQQMLTLDEVEADKEATAALKKIKSLRIVGKPDGKVGEADFDNALKLLQANDERYKLYEEYDEKCLYVRKKGDVFVELVLLLKENPTLLIDITGNMTEKFVGDLMGERSTEKPS